MRESNFAFPAQNKACVCISSQLYDRRALDTSSPLPIFNSLSQLTYLTSTSPRIREIMTQDGGLERLVKMLHEFCLSPPPPENPSLFYGLAPPSSRTPKPAPTLNPQAFDKHAAYRFSLAFQCVVNIGVRGSEAIRCRVVQAGTLEVVGCILEAWLAKKGFALGPGPSASGAPRETREQRHARRQAMAEQRQRDEAAELARALVRQIRVDVAQESDEGETSADTSTTSTPLGSNTPTAAVVVPGRERSGTIIARRTFDPPPRTHRDTPASPSPSSSRQDTETEDDEEDAHVAAADPPLRRTVGIVADGPTNETIATPMDARIMISDDQTDGVDQGIVSLEPNDDMAMGAPPEATPRPGITALPRSGNGTTRGSRDSGPYRDEDVLLSLQLLAYLSKYPHVRQAFYETRTSFHPAAAATSTGSQSASGPSSPPTPNATPPPAPPTTSPRDFFKSLTARGKEKAPPTPPAAPTSRRTNVFSLVERFTFRPSSSETEVPRLPSEIQYWAGVIMRNACRKDESRGGIRQCANMLCGKWETVPREFAKCRRCRKAKYCGKECQSTAWSEGHRFWCSARDENDDGDGDVDAHLQEASHHAERSTRHARWPQGATTTGSEVPAVISTVPSDTGTVRDTRDRERTVRGDALFRTGPGAI
ncbi:hypothetical protein CYLTODRAFT_372850 [Cylindrobasidium torrendii FP15055 ss-10]|uniref:MYND-type domain-containing protein n=1 Tax=Cylindrobasidium torrendii FP15055 ss-10 TaxID=1314674 RepID=A0A0D7BGU2_9AGAR|nr:hypothetical protein CYLTODRAFT_372850 [Cylindrobasidium torrendii FP15055 ss-10]